MIVVDTSALMAIVLDEHGADACMDCLAEHPEVAISAGTLAEAIIVGGRRGVRRELERLIAGLGMEVVAVTAASARNVADAYERWGKGVHPAGLNFGDCFAYELARDRGCPLLFVGDDFSRTDLERAVGSE